MKRPQEYGNCAFCDRTIGLQGGKLRPHKFDDETPLCPGSDLTATAANELFKLTLRKIVARRTGSGT